MVLHKEVRSDREVCGGGAGKAFFSLSIYINLATVKSIALLHQYAVNVDFMMQWL